MDLSFFFRPPENNDSLGKVDLVRTILHKMLGLNESPFDYWVEERKRDV
jgi:hypothetical protein